jgi:hypothetical protein
VTVLTVTKCTKIWLLKRLSGKEGRAGGVVMWSEENVAEVEKHISVVSS